MMAFHRGDISRLEKSFERDPALIQRRFALRRDLSIRVRLRNRWLVGHALDPDRRDHAAAPRRRLP
jgi:hypothetical protein